jgi:hypothetical protein
MFNRDTLVESGCPKAATWTRESPAGRRPVPLFPAPIRARAGWYNQDMEGLMTITPEMKKAVEQAGAEPVRVEDPESHTAYVVIREDAYRRLRDAVEIETVDPSFFECGEFIPLEK